LMLFVLGLSRKSDPSWMLFTLLFILSVSSRPIFHLPHPKRLYLWGVDYRRQMRFNLATSWIDPGFFACLLAAVGLVQFGNSDLVGWSWVFFLVGLKVSKAGCSEWPGLPLSLSRQALQTRKKPEPLKPRQMVWLSLVLGVGVPVLAIGPV